MLGLWKKRIPVTGRILMELIDGRVSECIQICDSAMLLRPDQWAQAILDGNGISTAVIKAIRDACNAVLAQRERAITPT